MNVQRIYEYWASVSWRSWIAHTLVSICTSASICSVAAIFTDNRQLWWMIGACASALFYLGKEIGDFVKYALRGTWTGDADDGVPHNADGVGDFIGPAALALGSIAMYVVR